MIDMKKVFYNLINILLSAFLSFSLVYGLTTSLLFDYGPFELIIFQFVLTIIWCLIFFNKTSIKIAGIITGSSLIIAIAFHIFTGKLVRLALEFSSFLSWILDYSQGYESLNKPYQLYLSVMLSAIITAAVYFLTLKRFNFPILLTGGVSIFCIQWIYEIFVSYPAFYLFLLFILVYYFIYIFNKKSSIKPNEFVNKAVFSIWMLPISLILIILCLIAPYKSKPVEFPWLDKKINTVFSYFSKTYNSYRSLEFFSISSTGFGETGSRLGGKVKLDKTLVMKVEAPKLIYLRGASREIFNGTRWTSFKRTQSTLSNSILHENDDIYELLLGLKHFSGKTALESKLISSYDIKVTYKDLAMKTIFAPGKTYNLDFSKGKPSHTYFDQNNIFTSKNVLAKNLEYKLKAYDMDFSNKEFIELLRKSKPALYNELSDKVNELDIKRLSEIYNTAYSTYTQLPEKISPRVKELSISITSSKKTKYDKVKALEDYLSRNYTYTLDPKSPPRHKDFLEYFLFDSMEGYCTYYATAMAIMVRSLGIPARYIEGYILPPSPKAGSVYDVTNEQAHAWVEVYFDGFGWIPFEPTAPFRASFYKSKQESEARFSQSLTSNPIYESYLNHMMGYGNINLNSAINYDLSSETKTKKNSYIVLTVVIAVGLLILILLSIILFNKTSIKYKLFKIGGMEPRDSILHMYNYYTKVLSILGYPMESGETPFEYGKRIDAYFIFNKPVSFRKVTDIFLVARYSSCKINEKDKILVNEFYEKIIKESKDHLGRVNFFFRRFIQGKI